MEKAMEGEENEDFSKAVGSDASARSDAAATQETPLSSSGTSLTSVATLKTGYHKNILPFISRGGALEEHLLLLRLCLQNSGDVEVYSSDLVKVIGGIQAAFRVADKIERDSFVTYIGNKESSVIPRLMCIIEASSDPVVVEVICGFLHDCLAPTCEETTRQQLIKTLVLNNAAEVLLRSFKGLPMNILSKGEFGFVHGLQVVAKLASKDAKLAVKCRLVGGVKYIHQLIQAHSKNSQLVLPLLMILKFIANNPTNQVVLGKDGCVTTLISLLNLVSKTHWAKVKLILENLALLTKTTSVSPRLSATIRAGGQKLQALLNCFFESNVIRLVRENGLSKVLSLLDSWEKIDERYQVKILRAVLYVVSHLCDSKHGQKAVLALRGDEVLHRFIVSCPSDPRFDFLLGIALNVFLKSSSKGELPAISLKGAVTFQIPSKDAVSQASSDSREELMDGECDSSDEEDLGNDEYDEDEEESSSRSIELASAYKPQTARLDDLIKMAVFFPEFQENSNSGTEVACSVRVPSRGGEAATPVNASELYLQFSSATKSLINFVKVAYPDMVEAEGPEHFEPLYQKNSKVIREKALRTVDRVLNSNQDQEKVVFDLDHLLESEHARQLITPTNPSPRNLSNWDEKRVGKKDIATNHLNFESRFESGNLRKVIQVAPYEYDLVLNSDVNSCHHHQWFYFEVSNMEAGVPYILNIINNEKPNSEFNFGMKPVIFSVKEALLGRSTWVRTGYDICYHKNHFIRFPKNSENTKFRRSSGKSYHTVSMTIEFPHANDVVYLAYHYPYTFSKLQAFLTTIERQCLPNDTFYKNQTFCHSLNGNPVPLLTITSKSKKAKEKEAIFLTARVHPGESNASWVIQGTIRFLLGPSEEARSLRENFIFKIVPMLNPEGVIHGNQRCGLTDEDLNRRWRCPSPVQHPTIYYTKTLIEHLTAVIGKRPLIFCDFHGHSRQKNVFMYGCSRQKSWWVADRDLPEEEQFMVLPRLAQLHIRTFSLSDCRFDIEKARESTARVAVWRQFHVQHSFTIEASTCGCDCGPYKNYHLSPKLLFETGEGFCQTVYHFWCQNYNLHKTFINSRLAWMGAAVSSTTTNLESLNDFNCVEDDLDSEDDLDFELYGMIHSKAENR